jgi:SurA N-terminal domain
MKILAILFVCFFSALPVRAETIDRVVASVNGRPILQSDVDESTRYEAFVEGKPLAQITAADMSTTMQRLVDQELLHQQMGEMNPEVSSSMLQTKAEEIRKQHASTPEQWRQALAAYGLDERAFMARLENQMRTLAFIDRRLRPSILVEGSAVEAYYKDTLLPQLHKAGAQHDPALSDVQHEIREILTQQRIDDTLATWLHNLRQQSRVRMLTNDKQIATGSTQGAK